MHTRAALCLSLLLLTPAACLPRDADVGPEHSSKKSHRVEKRDRKLSSKATKPRTRKHTKRALAQKDPELGSGFEDNFQRPLLGKDWRSTGSRWKIEGGRLCGSKAHNHPVWLKRKLPTNAKIEFEATSYSQDGDLKVEAWGDGASYASGTSYNDATSYIAIFGGWQNRFHVLARLREHAPDRPQVKLKPQSEDPRTRQVEPKRTYKMRIERRDGSLVQWFVDDTLILSYNDKQPLKGEGHDHFGFNDWEVKVCFDNLKITPL